MTLPGLPAFAIQPGSGAALPIDPDKTVTLLPGNYGDITLGSRSKLLLQSGDYRIGAFQVEPDAEIILNKTTGPVRIHMRSFVNHGKVIEKGGYFGQTLFAVSGPKGVVVEGPFIGTLLAPNADVTIGTGVAQEHRGAFLGRSVLVRSKATLYHLPWTYSAE